MYRFYRFWTLSAQHQPADKLTKMLGIWFPGGHGCLFGNYTLRPPFPLFHQQGGKRPSCAHLTPDLRDAGGDYQLLQQLRTQTVSREADSVGDYLGGGWRTDSPLRRRCQRAQLALCGRSRRGFATGGHSGAAGGELLRWWCWRSRQPELAHQQTGVGSDLQPDE